MIENALCEHLKKQNELCDFLTTYAEEPAIFNQEAPSDEDSLWAEGPQYGRIVFAVDLQGDPERTMGGVLAVDIMCVEDEQAPEDIEPVVRTLIHGYFFSSGTFTVAAQWKNSSYFTQPVDKVAGCTLTFDLLAFPMLTTTKPDVIARMNKWTDETFPNVHVINLDSLPETAWKPSDGNSAVYWRLVNENPAGWIPDTYQTIWRTATLKGHVFSEDSTTAVSVARDITVRLMADKRLIKEGESPIIVNRRNALEAGADPLRTGQITVEATYGVIVIFEDEKEIDDIKFTERRSENGK